MLGTTLAQVTLILKSELGSSMSVGTADDQRYYQLIETQQEWFASMYDWQGLKDEWEIAAADARYETIPTADVNANSHAINFDRPVLCYTKYSSNWLEVPEGIGIEQMNVYDSDESESADPVQRWRLKPGDRTLVELWPIPATAAKFRFVGQRKLKTLRSAGTFSTSLVLDLDDRLIALAIATDLLTAKEDPSAKAKSEKLQALWTTLRAAESKSTRSFSIGAPREASQRKVVPITVG